MCGGGANDCSALISADVWVSFKSRKNIIMASHLIAKTKSIEIINDIIIGDYIILNLNKCSKKLKKKYFKEKDNVGKACNENSTIIMKILLIYSEIKVCSRCLLKKYNDNLNCGQYFYLDCFVILIGCCLMSLSSPNYKVKEKTFSKLIINKIYLISIIGHSIAQLGILIVYFFCIIDRYDYYKKIK